jgi:glycosyltransferase involved in cell wall biosynthesis
MTILHVATYPFGGAFIGSYRLHKALLSSGVSSKMLVSIPPENQILEEVYCYDRKSRSSNLFNKVTSRIGIPHTANQKIRHFTKDLKGDYEVISFPFSDFDITESKEYQESDIINLHWVGGYIDFRSFFLKNRKPVVWTLRDSNPFNGIFHLKNDLDRNNESWKELNNNMIDYKKKCLSTIKSPLKIVGISNWIAGQSKASLVLNRFDHKIIHNCIDSEYFKPVNKGIARDKLNIDQNKIVLSFGASSLKRQNKGYDQLLKALNQIRDRNFEFLSFGEEINEVCHFSIRHRHLGSLDSSELPLVYSASDAFIFPTQEESLGNTMLEAMSCGLPVIGTPIGGLLDVIIPNFNGLFTKDVSADSIKEAIYKFLEIKDQFDPLSIRNYIKENFSEEIIAGKYIDLYKSIS